MISHSTAPNVSHLCKVWTSESAGVDQSGKTLWGVDFLLNCYLFLIESQICSEKIQREKSSVSWFTLQVAITAGAESIQR